MPVSTIFWSIAGFFMSTGFLLGAILVAFAG
jgi:hypothetical protein